MNENVFVDVLSEICNEEISGLNKIPPFKPSLRHRVAMKRIFALFEKNSRKNVSEPSRVKISQHNHMRLSKRVVVIVALIICAALLTGFMLVYISRSFHGTIYNDNTQLFAVDTENCITTIEYKYYLPELPNGFEMVERDSSAFYVYTLYENKFSGQIISLSQYTKNKYATHYNTEHHDLEEIVINDHGGLCIDFSNSESNHSIVFWDNGDYILEITGDFAKSELINLAKSTKVLEN